MLWSFDEGGLGKKEKSDCFGCVAFWGDDVGWLCMNRIERFKAITKSWKFVDI